MHRVFGDLRAKRTSGLQAQSLRIETLDTEETGFREVASAIDKFKKFRSRLQGNHSFASVDRILNNKFWKKSIFKAKSIVFETLNAAFCIGD